MGGWCSDRSLTSSCPTLPQSLGYEDRVSTCTGLGRVQGNTQDGVRGRCEGGENEDGFLCNVRYLGRRNRDRGEDPRSRLDGGSEGRVDRRPGNL